MAPASSSASLAVLCPGQGSQTSSMFDFATAHPEGAAVVATFSDRLDCDLLARARAGHGLFDNAFAQAATVSAAVATWAVLAPRLPRPSLFAGYSVGEVSAWACAGAWDTGVAADVVAARAAAMDRLGPSGCGMLAVRGLPLDAIERHADGLYVAIVNEADHAILAGTKGALDAAAATLAQAGAWTRRLEVAVPSHTPLLAAAATAFAATLRATPALATEGRVLRGVDGVACRLRDEMAEALPDALRRTIRWDACCRAMVESGIRVALELGPGRALAQLCAVNCPGIEVRSIEDFRSPDGMASWVARGLER